MKPRQLSTVLSATVAAIAVLAASPAAQAAPTLEGWAVMPAPTFSDGPTSGQFGFTNAASPANNPPYLNLQPVQGFSGVLAGAGVSHLPAIGGFLVPAYPTDIFVRAVVVALVVPILLLARSIGGQAQRINTSLGSAATNTAALAELHTTISSAEVIVDGLRRGRQKLGG